MKEERGDEDDGFCVGGVLAVWEEQEGEPQCGALHEEPCQRWRQVRAPPWPVVFPIGGLEEPEGDEGWWGYEVQCEECVVEERLI